DIAATRQEITEISDDPCPRVERSPRRRVHEQVEVALAVSRLDVLQAMPLLGERPKCLRKQADVHGLDRELAGPGPERTPGDADHVAEVEQPVDLETVVTEPVAAGVGLEPAGPGLELEKARPPQVAPRDEPAA